MSHKLVSLYIGEGEYYTRTDVDNVIAELEERIADGDKDFELKKCERYERHRQRWLELAEKFKET